MSTAYTADPTSVRSPRPVELAKRSLLRIAAVLVAAVALVAATATPIAARPDKDREPGKPATAVQPDDRARGRVGKPAAATRHGSSPELVTPTPQLSRTAQLIGATDLWADGITGQGVDVAVIDTGIAPVPGLDGEDKIVAVVDFSSEAADPDTIFADGNGHGTHMAGIIAGHDPDSGFTGMAPGAGIVAVKVADRNGSADVPSVIAAIDWVVEHRHADGMNIRVLNLSFGTERVPSGEVDPLQAAVERAWDAGIVVVVAAGNDGRPEMGLANPASNPWVIAVGAADIDKGQHIPARFSTRGDLIRTPDLAAPGELIESVRVPGSALDLEHPHARVGDQFFRGSGSSQATAVVSGAAALLLEARPELTADEVKFLLAGTTSRMAGNQNVIGSGLVDVAAAVTAPRPGGEAVQDWPRSIIEPPPDREARGEWYGATWYGATWYGATWYGATWYGASWYGATWYGATWY